MSKNPSHPESPCWNRPVEEVCGDLGTHPEQGLDHHEAGHRLKQCGRNELPPPETQSRWTILCNQLRSILVALLTAAAIASAAFSNWVEAFAVLAVLVINTAIGYWTELQAVRSMEALRLLGTTYAKVIRGGRLEQVEAAELVPGDLVVVESGDHVAADLRLMETAQLQADESSLTGESIPSGKQSEPVAPDAPIAERHSMLYRGTSVTRGSGRGVVVATGVATELGAISQLVAGAEKEETPLEHRLAVLGHKLVWLTLVLATIVGTLSVSSGTELRLAIETAIALAVASVPEGLPIIATLCLARGMHRMARRKALVNRLSAVETLGATSVICTDKTGTLTENRMTVVSLMVGSGCYRVSGEGMSTEGTFTRMEDHRAVVNQDDLSMALRIGALCNNAELTGEGVGDPLEVALLVAAAKAGIEARALDAALPRVREVAFDSERKSMVTVHRDEADGNFLVAVKGAPEAVLARSTSLDERQRQHWLEANEEFGREGLRVLGLACKRVSSPDEDPNSDLTWIGLVGMHDPPRPEVISAIAECQKAGVTIVMATGDQAVTATSVARAVGIRGNLDPKPGKALEGWEHLPEAEQDDLARTAVFSRVSPKEKLDLISLHQSRGNVVAMTGDGVNDAPALRKAEIGVAMGQRGTDVAREAADMVLQDDSFATIVAAIREGRVIFANLRAFVVYLLSCNLSEIMVIGLASLAGSGLPLLPLQILFLNLVTDVFPALALGATRGSSAVMKIGPRRAREALIDQAQWTVIFLYGLTITAAVLAAFQLAQTWLGMNSEAAVTVSFLAIALAQLFHVFNMHASGSGPFVNEVTANRWVWGAVALCLILLAAAMFIPAVAGVLELEPLEPRAWFLVMAAGAAPFALGRLVTVIRLPRPDSSS